MSSHIILDFSDDRENKTEPGNKLALAIPWGLASRETTGRQPSQNDTTPETAKKKEGTKKKRRHWPFCEGWRPANLLSQWEGEKERRRRRACQEGAKDQKASARIAYACAAVSTSSYNGAGLSSSSSSIQRPRAPPFFKSTITSIDFQLKWSRKVSISSAGTIGKRSRERPRSKRHRSSIKIIKKSIDCTTKIYRNGPEVTKNENYVQLLCASKGKWRHTRFVKTAKRKYRK